MHCPLCRHFIELRYFEMCRVTMRGSKVWSMQCPCCKQKVTVPKVCDFGACVLPCLFMTLVAGCLIPYRSNPAISLVIATTFLFFPAVYFLTGLSRMIFFPKLASRRVRAKQAAQAQQSQPSDTPFKAHGCATA